MSSLTLRSTFGSVTIGGLLDGEDLARRLVAEFTDPCVRGLLLAAVDAHRGGDSSEYEARIAALADAVTPLEVALSADEARRLREQLIGLRLGQGSAAPSVYGRRIPT